FLKVRIGSSWFRWGKGWGTEDQLAGTGAERVPVRPEEEAELEAFRDPRRPILKQGRGVRTHQVRRRLVPNVQPSIEHVGSDPAALPHVDEHRIALVTAARQ